MRFYNYLYLVFFILSLAGCSTTGTHTQEGEGVYNHLKNESSPYLLQHAKNPVDWYPWGEDALSKAKADDKLIIISIGYAACHWCHVMEHESFEDTIVSNVMNEHFVSIKVDREERPDIDDVYMTACRLATGKNCGWPLNAVALPDGRPVWAGTYFPKNEWIKVLEYFIDLRENKPEELEKYASQITAGIQDRERISFNNSDFDFNRNTLDEITKAFLTNIDFKEGGAKGTQKFPRPNNYEFLLREAVLQKNKKAEEAVYLTLDKMAFGGIYDHLAGGFSRYTVDDIWKVPHFEKMLYDNGQLVSLYSKAYQVSKNPLYKQVVEETLNFIETELTSPEGGFYSSLDADSEGEEGKFYVWTYEEIEHSLGDEKVFDVFKDYYNIKKNGNWEEEKNIIFRKKTKEAVAKQHKMGVEELDKVIAGAKSTLMEVRSKRVRPGLDDKVLSAWNGLMLNGYIDAYKALGDEKYKTIAVKNAEFIVSKMMDADGRLNRNYKSGKSVINAFLDDYAILIDAFTSLYQITFDEKWLEKGELMIEYVLAHFSEEESKMFNYTSDLDPPLIAKKMELADNVIPGSTSSIARALYKVGILKYKPEYVNRSKQMLNNMAPNISEAEVPNFYSNWCILYSEMVAPPYEVAIVGNKYDGLLKEMNTNYLPNALLLGGKTEGSLDLLKDKLQEGETMIYVCQNRVCKFPVTEVPKALALIN